MTTQTEALFPRPLSGARVDALPSGLVPARTALEGRHIRLEPMDPAVHAAELYDASHTTDAGRAIWTYLPEGPWSDRAAYTASLAGNAGDLTRVFYALRPQPEGPASGQASFMDIEPGNGVIEIGYIWFAPALQRTRILNAACAGSRRSTAAITTGRTWRSTRVPSDLLPAVAPARQSGDYTRSAAPEV